MIDVLEKNAMGRSALTEAFSSGNTEAIAACLSHETATEDRLIPGGKEKEDKEGEEVKESLEEEKEEAEGEGEETEERGKEKEEKGAITHRMRFSSSGPVVLARELPISRADNPFGTEDHPEEDTTGLGIWPASILLSRWIAELGEELFEGKTVLELGCGCGLPGLVTGKTYRCLLLAYPYPVSSSALYCSPKQVFLSDIHDPTLDNARHNIFLNTQSSTTRLPFHFALFISLLSSTRQHP